MTDYRAMIKEHSCKPNQGCGVMTICMCGVAEDMADEIERLRDAIRQADCVLQLLAPENHSQTTEAEMASLLSSISEKLSRMVEEWDSAALGEKE